jgi:beta-ureidopropionase
MSKVIRAALVQTKSVISLKCNSQHLGPEQVEEIRDANIEHNLRLVGIAEKQGSQIVCLNELFTAPYFAISNKVEGQWMLFAEHAENGATATALKQHTINSSIVIVAPIYEQDQSGKKYNTTIVVEGGAVIGKYRKSHIPHGKNEQGTFTEGYYYRASDELGQNERYEQAQGHDFFPVFQTSIGRVGIATCFDRHFSYVWDYLKAGGAQIVFSPAVTFGEVSQRMWKHEFPTEAVRNRMFIGGSNKKGNEFLGGPIYFGESYFTGPDGGMLHNTSPIQELVISDLDISLTDSDASGWDLKKHRRSFVTAQKETQYAL